MENGLSALASFCRWGDDNATAEGIKTYMENIQNARGAITSRERITISPNLEVVTYHTIRFRFTKSSPIPVVHGSYADLKTPPERNHDRPKHRTTLRRRLETSSPRWTPTPPRWTVYRQVPGWLRRWTVNTLCSTSEIQTYSRRPTKKAKIFGRLVHYAQTVFAPPGGQRIDIDDGKLRQKFIGKFADRDRDISTTTSR